MCEGVTRQGWQLHWKELLIWRRCVCGPYAVVCAHVPETLLIYELPVCATKRQCEERGSI